MKFEFYLNSVENSAHEIEITNETGIYNTIVNVLFETEKISFNDCSACAIWSKSARINDDFTTDDFTIYRKE